MNQSRAPSQPSILPGASIYEFASYLGLTLSLEVDRVLLEKLKVKPMEFVSAVLC